MKHKRIFILVGIIIICVITVIFLRNNFASEKQFMIQGEEKYWLVLHRKSNREELYKGIPGKKEKSILIKTFRVKTGIPGERPTPLPSLLGREYWVITEKHPELQSPETAPYFITLNIPAPSIDPYGPSPYDECHGQCNWVRPGAFGLHGVNGDKTRLSDINPGSSGCIRHTDQDITFLYNLLDPENEEIRYYVEDN